jgi:hypothetical protein
MSSDPNKIIRQRIRRFPHWRFYIGVGVWALLIGVFFAAVITSI